MISDLPEVKVARGRGRPRKTTETAAIPTADANPTAETAEKKRRGRPKKDKSVTISSNDDEDALIEKMMADVASMQKHDVAVVIADPADDEPEPYSPIQPFTGPLMRCESLSPVVQTSSASSSSSFQQFEVEAPTTTIPAPKAATKTKSIKEPKAKEPKTPKETKAPKETKTPKETKAPKKGAKASVVAAEVVAPLASFSAIPTHSDSRQENQETNGRIYLIATATVPTTSFTHNGHTYLRTETDNVYDNLTHELIGVWDHSNHEIIAAFDDEFEEIWSDEE
jgi:hypothetical protein